MRYHYQPRMYPSGFGKTYICNHPVYTRCTLFTIGDRGLAVIQQRYDPKTKHTWWNELDTDLPGGLYLNPNFKDYFNSRSGIPINGLYPTVTVRQMMWAMKMKPLKKERWESVFDRRDI